MEDWSAEKIKYELMLKGFNVTKAAQKAGVTMQVVSNSINGRQKSPSADKTICDILEVDASIIWPSRYVEGVTVGMEKSIDDNLTSEQIAKLEGSSNVPERRKNWSRYRIERQINMMGYINLRQVERVKGIPEGSISQAASRKSERVDQAISDIIEIPVWEIFPNRYWIGGGEIPKTMNIETVSDRQFDDFKRTMGVNNHLSPYYKKPKNNDGTINHPFYDQPVEPDISPYADKRSVVTLPVGMKLDV